MRLQEHNVVPVLYASQWFLTVFSCPFLSAFACRIIDVILAEGHTEIMLQVRCCDTTTRLLGFSFQLMSSVHRVQHDGFKYSLIYY